MFQQLKKSPKQSWLTLPSEFGISLYFYFDQGRLASVDMKLDCRPRAYIFSDDDTNRESLVCFLDSYFEKKHTLKLPLSLKVTPFQQTVYQELMQVPFGKTISYSDLSEKIGRPRAHRAVAAACKNNRLPFVIPCHRVVYKNKQIGGFNKGIEIKKKLLLFENK